MDRDRLTGAVLAAGVIGCGGAGFPTQVKLARKAGWFIVNGVECEPLLRSDRTVMRLYARELVSTIEKIASHLEAERFGIALKHSYAREIDALSKAIASLGSRVELYLLEHFYPAGDEQMVVNQVTGRVVPPGGIPLDVDAVVSNAATVLAIHDALHGVPLTMKHVTVTGAVRKPVVFRAPVGTLFTDCLAAAGGASAARFRLIDGGPLMGKLIEESREFPASVSKTTSGIVVVPEEGYLATLAETRVEHTVNRTRSACIQCNQCTQMCPRHLLGHPLEPHRIMRALGHGGGIDEILDTEPARQALLCCECGVCEIFACPMGLQPRRVNALLKRALTRAGLKYSRQGTDYTARDELMHRKVPTRRIAARAGILEHYDAEEPAVEDFRPNVLVLSLKQGLGVPAVPTVRAGDTVAKGQLIAACPSGKLGSNLHSGMDGVVTRIDTHIVIQRC